MDNCPVHGTTPTSTDEEECTCGEMMEEMEGKD